MTNYPMSALAGLGQSIWLDNITRELLDSGRLQHFIQELSVTGLTSNPTIFDHAISGSSAYDAEIQRTKVAKDSCEALFFALAITDLRRAADLFMPIHQRTGGTDGFVSLEVSPELAYDGPATIDQALALHTQAARSNLFIKIPGTVPGLEAIEACIFAGVPINVTLLFSVAQYRAAADAWAKGLERRAREGLSLDVASVASLFVSRWDTAVTEEVSHALRHTLGVAVATSVYQAYRDFNDSDRFQRLANLGARPQRLLFASTGTKVSTMPATFYIDALAAPNTVNTMPEATLLAFAEHGVTPPILSPNSQKAALVIAEHEAAGIDIDILAQTLQANEAKAFVGSWQSLLAAIAGKQAALN
jgi:transaldolase